MPEALQSTPTEVTTPEVVTETPAPNGAELTAEQIISAALKADADAEAKGAAPAAEAKPTKPKLTDEKPKEPEPSVSARINAAKKAEQRAAKERQEQRAERDANEATKKELETLRAEAEAYRAAKKSPSKALEILGLGPKEFIEGLAQEHQHPEAAAVSAEVAAEREERLKLAKEVADLKAEKEANDAAAKDAASKAELARLDADVVANQRAFVAFVKEKRAEYPHTVEEYTPNEIAYQALQLSNQYAETYKAKFGAYPDNDVIAEQLEVQAKARAAERSSWRGDTSEQSAEQLSKSTSDPNSGHANKASTPRTLTNAHASEKGSGQKPWTQEDADEQSKAMLQAALRATG